MKKFIFTAGSYNARTMYYIEANNELEALNKLKTYYENVIIYQNNRQFSIGESDLDDWLVGEITKDIDIIM